MATFKLKYREFIARFKRLQGDPHYIAMGLAAGIFIAFTPTIPFHMLLSLSLAYILKGSKPAAILGSWFGNPMTVPFFYLASYKAGVFLTGLSVSMDVGTHSARELMAQGLDIFLAMIFGGAVIGILPAVLCYFLTKKIVIRFRAKEELPPAPPPPSGMLERP